MNGIRLPGGFSRDKTQASHIWMSVKSRVEQDLEATLVSGRIDEYQTGTRDSGFVDVSRLGFSDRKSVV